MVGRQYHERRGLWPALEHYFGRCGRCRGQLALRHAQYFRGRRNSWLSDHRGHWGLGTAVRGGSPQKGLTTLHPLTQAAPAAFFIPMGYVLLPVKIGYGPNLDRNTKYRYPPFGEYLGGDFARH